MQIVFIWENFQNSSIVGTANSLPLSLPVVSNAASLTGSACNFSRVSAPAVSSAWLLPSNSGTSFQPLMGSAYLYQHSSTAMLSGVTSQHQIPMTPASYPSVFEWDITGGASVGLRHPSQTFCLPQPPEFLNSCSSRSIQKLQILESNPPTDLGDISVITPGQSSSDFLALPLTQSKEQTDSNSLDEIKVMLSNPLDAYKFAIENQDPPLLPLEISDIHQLLASIGPLDQEETPHSEHNNLGKSSLSLEDQGTLENGIECSSDFADLTALVGDIHLPEIFNFFKDLDQPGTSKPISAPRLCLTTNSMEETQCS
uniref:Uncharacterized protein n=1 Tax=Sciurus vulgaris TaxID=55149 RepID=A0A8D2DRG2_SCIVU